MSKGEHFLSLNGGPYQRGRQQIEQNSAQKKLIVNTIRQRLFARAEEIDTPQAQDFMTQLMDFCQSQCPAFLQEIEGIADGLEIGARVLFSFVFLGTIEDFLLGRNVDEDGCSTWARQDASGAMLVGKNRDFFGADAGLQRVFHSKDPQWNGMEILSVGSLGAPAVYSSGINTAGLAVVDTRISSLSCGVGWLRYFMMQKILIEASTVGQALSLLQNCHQAGGGSLILADKEGYCASVELLHGKAVVQADEDCVCHTNHFFAEGVSHYTRLSEEDTIHASSQKRLMRLQKWLAQSEPPHMETTAKDILASHDDDAGTGLCRHNQGGDGNTISGVIYNCAQKNLLFSPTWPCRDNWLAYNF